MNITHAIRAYKDAKRPQTILSGLCQRCGQLFYAPFNRITAKNCCGQGAVNKTKEHIEKMVIAKTGNKNPAWKGDNVSQSTLHSWLKTHYGNPQICSFCGCDGFVNKGQWTIEWALRKGFQYSKNVKHFKPLCIKCHRNYDSKNNRLGVR